MRLFLAVWPSPEVVDVLRALPRPDTPGVRWSTEDQWHVTVEFLGECDLAPATRCLSGEHSFGRVNHIGVTVTPPS